MQDEADILDALQGGVIAAVAQSDDPDLPVKYLLTSFTQPADDKWLELVWLPNNERGAFRGDEMNHRGILRLILHWPNESGDVYEPVNLMASITRYFTNGLLLSGVQVYSKPIPTGMVENGADVLFPVSIYYQSYRKGA